MVSQALQNPATSTSLNAAYAAYSRQLDQQEVTHQSMSLVGFEYQSKARGRQLDTLLHLSHFSDYLVLISAPSGAGKTTFIEQFMRVQPAEACIVHLVLQETVTAPWIIRQLIQQLPVQLPNHAGLEASILAIQELAQQLTLQKEVLLIVVDDAQWLDEDALELLANLLPRSAKVDSRPHVILCADHSVVERIETPQFAELRQERFYHVVLAPFSQEESADYLRQRLQRIGLNHGLAPIQLLQLHQLAKGNPGYLNMLANKALNKGGFVQQTGLPWLHIAATVVVVAILVAIWLLNYFSDNNTVANKVQPQPVVVEAIAALPMAKALPPLEPIELSPAPKNVTLEPKPEPKPEPAVEAVAVVAPVIPAKIVYSFNNYKATILFDTDSAVITADAAGSLTQLAMATQKAESVMSVKVVGYADSRGEYNYNMALSEKRMTSVSNFLDDLKLKVTSRFAKGETVPVLGPNGEDLSLSRRVDVSIKTRHLKD